jgi:hypothetical protein
MSLPLARLGEVLDRFRVSLFAWARSGWEFDGVLLGPSDNVPPGYSHAGEASHTGRAPENRTARARVVLLPWTDAHPDVAIAADGLRTPADLNAA